MQSDSEASGLLIPQPCITAGVNGGTKASIPLLLETSYMQVSSSPASTFLKGVD